MKLLHSIFCLLTLLSLTTHASSVTPDTLIVGVTQSTEPDYTDDKPVRHRTPPKQLLCTITKETVNIPSIPAEEIYLFEVYNTEGMCLESTSSEQDFISFIFEIKGCVEIRFHSEGSVFHGFIEL